MYNNRFGHKLAAAIFPLFSGPRVLAIIIDPNRPISTIPNEVLKFDMMVFHINQLAVQ